MTIVPSDERLPMLTGTARYLDDISPAGCLHVAFLRSPYASAKINAIETTAAETAPGVQHVLVGENLADVVMPIETRMDEADWYEYQQTSWPVIAIGEVRFVGEIVAAVVASDAYLAENACAAIEVDYDVREPVVNARAAAASTAPLVNSQLASNVLFHNRFKSGGGAESFAAAHHRVSCTFRHPRVSAAPIECCGALASYDSRHDVIELCTPSQVPHMLRDGLARCLRHPESKVRIITPDVGGAFGVKMPLYPEEVIIAHAARALGRPVKWMQDRREHLLTSFHARDAFIEAELAADEDGRIAGLRASMWCDVGAYSSSYCQKLCMGLSCGGAILAFSIHEFDASNDLGELI